MKYQVCDCDPLEYCEHKQKKKFILPPLTKEALDRINEVGRIVNEEMKKKMATRCNCDASCGENRYHDVGSSGCRFGSESEHDAYWGRQPKEFPEMYDQPLKQVSATRPWGEWHVLDVDQGYKVKRLHILPDQAISLQYHVHRSEHWTIVQGEGKVIVDGNIFTVKKGESFHVPKQALHKITNTHLNETLIAIEVQMGEICSEDDIVRC